MEWEGGVAGGGGVGGGSETTTSLLAELFASSGSVPDDTRDAADAAVPAVLPASTVITALAFAFTASVAALHVTICAATAQLKPVTVEDASTHVRGQLQCRDHRVDGARPVIRGRQGVRESLARQASRDAARQRDTNIRAAFGRDRHRIVGRDAVRFIGAQLRAQLFRGRRGRERDADVGGGTCTRMPGGHVNCFAATPQLRPLELTV